MVRRGSPVRVRKRALQKASKWAFCCPGVVCSSFDLMENLSPRRVPNVGLAADSRLEQTYWGAQSTFVVGRCSSDDVSVTDDSSGAGRLSRSAVRPYLGSAVDT